jgi:hypothetical protein
MRTTLALALLATGCHCSERIQSRLQPTQPEMPVPKPVTPRPPPDEAWAVPPGTLATVIPPVVVPPEPPPCTMTGCQGTTSCDVGSKACVPVDPTEPCQTRNPTEPFIPALLWRHDATAPWDQVMMTPLAIDLTADGVPDVVATFYSTSLTGQAVLKALDGNDGHLLWQSTSTDLSPLGNIAAADLQGDGSIEIIALTNYSYNVVAHSGTTGARLWTAKNATGGNASCAYGQFYGPAIANLDGQGDAEVYCGMSAWSSSGAAIFSMAGAVNPPNGPLTIAVDLDADGQLEVTNGAAAMKPAGSPMSTFTQGGYNGLPAAGDFIDGLGRRGRDGSPEIVVVGNGQLALVDGLTGALLAGPIALPGLMTGQCRLGVGSPGNGGAPTVADYDGDGFPDVGAASRYCYSVFTLDDTGGNLHWRLMWSKQVQDHSSSSTGSSVFDFDGDGAAEVVYADEIALHVYNGSDGTEILRQAHCSGTAYENPVIVDVNNDGHADIIVAENDYARVALGCDLSQARAGIRVYRDSMNRWMPTRKIWNQHAYHITNVCDGVDQVCGGMGAAQNRYGALPLQQQPNWAFTNLPPGTPAATVLNNFRMNTSENGLHRAADLVGRDLQAICASPVALLLRVVNRGELTAPAGVLVSFSVNGAVVGTGRTSMPIAPGHSETVRFNWVPPAGITWPATVSARVNSDVAVTECRTDNNELSTGVSCGAQ